MNRFSPLRYPGGKGKIAAYLSELISLNGLEGGQYVEPFAGGAAVALELLFSEKVSCIHINDLDPCVHAFWYSVVEDTDEFVSMIINTPVTPESWHAAREVRRHPDRHSRLELGFATFFQNRTNRSGILNGGMIGGLEQSGTWKLDCRYNQDDLISRIRRIGFFRSRICVHSSDGGQLVSELSGVLPEKTIFYIDPPYYVKGASLYQNHFRHEDHVRLGEVVSELRSKWIVSYDDSPAIRAIYQRFHQEGFGIDYTARTYARGEEVMIFSPGLRRPDRIYCSEKERRALVA